MERRFISQSPAIFVSGAEPAPRGIPDCPPNLSAFSEQKRDKFGPLDFRRTASRSYASASGMTPHASNRQHILESGLAP